MAENGEGRECQVINFPDLYNTEVFNNKGTDYARQMARHVIDACLRFDLAPEFVPMFEACLQDLNLVTFDERETDNPKPALLDLQKIPDKDTDDGMVYKRLMLVSEQEVYRRAGLLRAIFKEVNLTGTTRNQRVEVATDWIFYELSMAALGMACFMQKNFTNYVSDWNGTSEYDNAHRTVSTDFLSENPEYDITAREDTRRLIKGFGIMMLHNVLIAKGLVNRAVHADWVIQALRARFPLAYRAKEIGERLAAVKPTKDVNQEIANFVINVIDPEIEVDDVDITKDF